MNFNKRSGYSAPVKFTNNCVDNPKQLSGTAAEITLKSALGNDNDNGDNVLQKAKKSCMNVELNPAVKDSQGNILATIVEYKNK